MYKKNHVKTVVERSKVRNRLVKNPEKSRKKVVNVSRKSVWKSYGIGKKYKNRNAVLSSSLVGIRNIKGNEVKCSVFVLRKKFNSPVKENSIKTEMLSCRLCLAGRW